LVQNFAPEPHAMHGVGWQRAWTTLHCDGRSAAVLLEHAASDAWPFAFSCRQDFRLDEDALHMSLSLSNTGEVDAPAGLGWHPYIVKRPGSRVRFQASAFWETDAQGLPMRRVPSRGLEAGCDGLDVNHAFEGWSGPAVVTDDTLEVSITSNLARLIVSTNPSKSFIAVEPVSHIPDSFNRPDETLDTVTLQPLQTLHAQMQIRVRRAD
jgi:aldose 1-epimerase